MKVINENGYELDFDAAVELMDGDICEQIDEEDDYETEQEFFSAYEVAHAKKYGEDWELSKANPTW